MKIEIYESLSMQGRSEEDILFDALLEELLEKGYEITRYNPVSDQEKFLQPQVSELLDTYALPYFFKDGVFCYAGDYNLNHLRLGKKSCSGCSGCSKKACGKSCAGCKKH